MPQPEPLPLEMSLALFGQSRRGTWERKQRRTLSIIWNRQTAKASVPNPEARRVLNSYLFIDIVHKITHTSKHTVHTHLTTIFIHTHIPVLYVYYSVHTHIPEYLLKRFFIFFSCRHTQTQTYTQTNTHMTSLKLKVWLKFCYEWVVLYNQSTLRQTLSAPDPSHNAVTQNPPFVHLKKPF